MSSLFNVPKGAFTSAMPLNLQNHEQNKSHLQSFRLLYSLPTHTVTPLPVCGVRVIRSFHSSFHSNLEWNKILIKKSVIKYLSKATVSGEVLSPRTGYSPPLMEVRLYPLLWDVSGGNLRARTEAEAMKEYCLLAYSLWLARPDFLHHQDHLWRVALPRGGWTLLNHSSIKENVQTYLSTG